MAAAVVCENKSFDLKRARTALCDKSVAAVLHSPDHGSIITGLLTAIGSRILTRWEKPTTAAVAAFINSLQTDDASTSANPRLSFQNRSGSLKPNDR